MRADFGSNYVGIKKDLEMESLDQEEVKRIQLELQSSGTQLVQKSPKTPWVQGSAEHAVKLTKKVIPRKYSFTIFQWLRLMEFVE